MKILIVGGTGLIGSRLTNYLLKKKYDVTIATRNISSIHFKKNKFDVVEIKWDNRKQIYDMCKGKDVVINAAGTNYLDSENNPEMAVKVNQVGTSYLLDCAIKACAKTFIYFSTAHVYSNKMNGFITEDTKPLNNHPYATSHLGGEKHTLCAHNKTLINGYVVRLSNAFGFPFFPNIDCWKLFTNNLCKQVVESNEMVINTSGKQMRDFIAIEDICEFIENLLSNKSFNKKINKPINLGSQNSLTLLAMAEIIKQRCLVKFNIQPKIKTLSESNNELINYSFSSEYLTNNNIKTNKFFINELDSLLEYCFSNFRNFSQ